jgi:hypothetical protein
MNPPIFRLRVVRRRARFLLRAALIACLVSPVRSLADTTSVDPPSGWEDVPALELGPTQPMVSGSNAEYLFRKLWAVDHFTLTGLSQTCDVYVRLKIYTAEGAQQFSQIRIFVPPRKVRIDQVHARTIAPDGSIVELSRRAVITETMTRASGRNLREITFATPAVVPGSIIEYRFEQTSFDEAAAAQLYDLQFPIPVQSLTYYMTSAQVPNLAMRRLIFHSPATTTLARGGTITAPNDQTYAVSASHVPAYVDEPDGPPPLESRGYMLAYYDSHGATATNEYWDSLGKNWAAWFAEYTRPDDDIRRYAEAIAKKASSDRDRARALIEWIRANFRIDRGSANETRAEKNKSVHDAFQQGAGSAFDSNMLFAAMARALHMEVRYFRVADRALFVFNRNLTDAYFLSGSFVALRMNDSWVGLDPGSQYLPWDMMPWIYEGQLGLLCDPDSTGFVTSPIAEPERNMQRLRGTLALQEDGTVEGDIAVDFTGQENGDIRSWIEAVPQYNADSVLTAKLAAPNEGVAYSNATLKLSPDPHEWVHVQSHVKLGNFGTVTGKRIVLAPSIFHSLRQARYTSSTRERPIYYLHPWSESDSLDLKIPTGWKLEAVDSTQTVSARHVARYTASIAADSTTIHFVRSFQMGFEGTIYVGASGYSSIKQLFDLVHDRDRAAVTLVRADAPR